MALKSDTTKKPTMKKHTQNKPAPQNTRHLKDKDTSDESSNLVKEYPLSRKVEPNEKQP